MASRDSRIARTLLEWFDAAARDLPWRPPGRAGRRDPYHTLVSEFMLQQTQAARVAERFPRFLARFPSLAHLARADEQDVLAEWSGLGYYARARNLHAAARAVADLPHARLPHDPDQLTALPGVGRYTAGAIASLAFNTPTPAVDGNVSRVILRLEAKDLPLAGPGTLAFAHGRATQLLATEPARASAGALNEALIELGATICTPRSPRCEACPLARECRARKLKAQARIPRAKPPARQKHLRADSVLIRDRAGRLLIERRPRTGLWAAMWQAPTLESPAGPDEPGPTARQLPRLLHLPGLNLGPRPVETFTHATTHRLVQFRIWTAAAPRDFAPGPGPAGDQPREWKKQDQIAMLAISNPQRRILLADRDSLFDR
ncbi:MAG: A/G-specific adenine glycosylase [Phycisphaerales bacterium]|nr:A/G-specific adenine glycosylase [Phycisphaerales bacterium]